MTVRWQRLWALAALAALAWSASATAAEWESYATFKFERRSVELPDGRTVATFVNNGAYQNVWPDRITAGTLACTGMVESSAEGVELDVYCEHVDADGDRQVARPSAFQI